MRAILFFGFALCFCAPCSGGFFFDFINGAYELGKSTPSAIAGTLFSAYEYIVQPRCKLDTIEVNTRLTSDLSELLIGQHIVTQYVKLAVSEHLSSRSLSNHALSFVFLGATGTGKTYVAHMVQRAFHGGHSDFYRFYSGRLDFPSSHEIDSYRKRLRSEIEYTVKRCPNAIFIFDEIDKVPAGVLDIIKPYMDYHAVINGVDYRRAVFIFLTNWGSKDINAIYLNLRDQGVAREGMQYKHFENSLRHSLYDSSDGAFRNSDMIKDFVVSFYLPFLPMDKNLVVRCMKMNMRRVLSKQQIERVLEQLVFYEGLSISGCKRIEKLVALEQHRGDEL